MNKLNQPSDDEEIDVFARDIPDDVPVRKTLAAEVNVDLMVNKKSEVWLAHDKPLPGILQWVEYDVEMGTLTLVTDQGKIQDVGIRIQPAMRKYLRRAHTIDALLIQQKKVNDMYRVPLIVQEAVLN